MKIKLKRKQAGSGMIEILIATGVVALVMTAVISGFVLSVKSTTSGRDRVLAATRAQEAMEIFRREKVLLGWAQFEDSIREDFAGESVNEKYCLDFLPADSIEFQAMLAGFCSEQELIPETIFTREASVEIIDDGIRVEIIVDWLDNNKPVSLVQEFKQYESKQ